MVKELRERTGLGMMDCKKSLVEAGGDMELAIEELRKKSVLKAAKKSGRITANGLLGLKTSEDLSRAAIVEINIETDFAAKNEKFISFVSKVADAVYNSEEDLTTLMESGLDEEERLWCRRLVRIFRCEERRGFQPLRVVVWQLSS